MRFREILLDFLFGSSLASPNAGPNEYFGRTTMGILLLKVLATWSLIATVTGFVFGAAIRKGDQARKDVFLSCVFSSLEALQGSRS
jgi:hypothetical protein